MNRTKRSCPWRTQSRCGKEARCGGPGGEREALLDKLQAFPNALLPLSSPLGHTAHVTPHIRSLKGRPAKRQATGYTGLGLLHPSENTRDRGHAAPSAVHAFISPSLARVFKAKVAWGPKVPTVSPASSRGCPPSARSTRNSWAGWAAPS